MTGTAIVLRERVLVLFLIVSHNIHVPLSNNASVMSLKYIVLDAAPLELIISLQHAVVKLSNHE